MLFIPSSHWHSVLTATQVYIYNYILFEKRHSRSRNLPRRQNNAYFRKPSHQRYKYGFCSVYSTFIGHSYTTGVFNTDCTASLASAHCVKSGHIFFREISSSTYTLIKEVLGVLVIVIATDMETDATTGIFRGQFGFIFYSFPFSYLTDAESYENHL